MPADAAQVAELVSASASPLVVTDVGAVRVFVLNAPERHNALSVAMRQALADAASDVRSDAGPRAVVLTGAAGTFCSGLDLSEEPPADGRLAVEPHPAAAIASLELPTVAAVDGFCLTGGLELALACSFIVASDRAVFADTHVALGIIPRWGMTVRLPAAVGVRRARAR